MRARLKKKVQEKQTSDGGTSEEGFCKEEVHFFLFPRFCANEAPDMNYVIIMGDLVSCLKGASRCLLMKGCMQMLGMRTGASLR